jgi:hypothetical protein
MKRALAIVSYLNFETIQIRQDCNNFKVFRYTYRVRETVRNAHFGQTPRKARMSATRLLEF